MTQIVPGQPITVQFPNMSELQRQAQAAPRILSLASEIPATNQAQVDIANEALKGVLRARDALEADRVEVTGPLHKTKAWIDAQYKPVRDTLDAAAKILRDKVGAFVLEQRREKDRQFALAQQAHAAGQHAAMAQALNQSSAVQAAAPAGTSVGEVWEAEVFNPAIVPHAFLCPDLAKIGAHAADTPPDREPAPIPGVRFMKRITTTVRR